MAQRPGLIAFFAAGGFQIRPRADRQSLNRNGQRCFRVAVVIFAVAESPGRRFSGGSCSVTTTLKSFASWLAEVCCEVETPVERTMALLPISVTTALKVFFGIASMVTSAGWPRRHVDDVGFVDLDFGGDDRHVGQSSSACCRVNSGCRSPPSRLRAPEGW